MGVDPLPWRNIRCHYGGTWKKWFLFQRCKMVYDYKGGRYMDTPKWDGDYTSYIALLCWILDTLPLKKAPLVDMYWLHGEQRKVIETEADLLYMWKNATADVEGKTHIYVEYIQPIAVDESNYRPSREVTHETPAPQASKKRAREDPLSADCESSEEGSGEDTCYSSTSHKRNEAPPSEC